MSNAVTVCSNPECESVIRKGQRVWRRGADLYCHSKCLLTSFGVPYEQKVLREKEVMQEAIKQERIAMMQGVFAKRQKRAVVE
ncbi:hypothetical protein QT711_11420 [Sporosarcina saromensis]|uniref:Uncharacterized protein n=1 Tax=Sporosarcina saromensis TaxID=359365 RepID=A0ABU4GDZ0_9BACL|nr:hypothetical protein [Sporosarcina saromensis]MDW0113797.1 hypothetical protein [Sporosarcina saromensis]